jgi:hypothetical protein
MNPLVIPAKARAYVYGLFGVLSLAVGAVQVGYAAIDSPAPDWLRVALAVVPFIGAGIGYTAATHTTDVEPAGYVSGVRIAEFTEPGAEDAARSDGAINIYADTIEDVDKIVAQAEAYRQTRRAD